MDKEYFEYLMELRDSGVTNMLGAAPYLVEAFDIEKKEAKEVLVRWMKSFDVLVSDREDEDEYEYDIGGEG